MSKGKLKILKESSEELEISTYNIDCDGECAYIEITSGDTVGTWLTVKQVKEIRDFLNKTLENLT